MANGGSDPENRVAVVMTCHNRRSTTLSCLEALQRQEDYGETLSLFVTDDGSEDGTAEAIRELWPDAKIMLGSGDLYWAAGMALAERAAMADEPDFLLWLNDDTVLRPDALRSLLALSQEMPGTVIVGATVDPITGELSYGGRLRIDYHPQRFQQLPLSGKPQHADTFHGNVVLIPRAVRLQVGPIDGSFPHGYADDDYGLRATALGVPIVQAPGMIGTCRRDEVAAPSPNRGLAARWRQLQSPKGLPWRAQTRYLRRHGDWRWPLILAVGQVRQLVGKRQ